MPRLWSLKNKYARTSLLGKIANSRPLSGNIQNETDALFFVQEKRKTLRVLTGLVSKGHQNHIAETQWLKVEKVKALKREITAMIQTANILVKTQEQWHFKSQNYESPNMSKY